MSIRKLYLLRYEYFELYYNYGIYSDLKKLLADYEKITNLEKKEQIENIVVYEFEENKLEGGFVMYWSGGNPEFEESSKQVKIEALVAMIRK